MESCQLVYDFQNCMVLCQEAISINHTNLWKWNNLRHSTWVSPTNYINSMEQSPSCEADRSSTSREFSGTSWNANVYYSIHNSPPSVPILNQIKPVQTQSHFFNIILPSIPRSSNCAHSFRSQNQNPACTSTVPHTRHILCTSISSSCRKIYHKSGTWWNIS
jgi:hypothetical protein